MLAGRAVFVALAGGNARRWNLAGTACIAEEAGAAVGGEIARVTSYFDTLAFDEALTAATGRVVEAGTPPIILADPVGPGGELGLLVSAAGPEEGDKNGERADA